ncbi:MAG: PDZ domain-containing protein [Planctomycetota bacterium]|nr:MAG: PDZ domain-containing protein [Planctomycetota bacterium]
MKRVWFSWFSFLFCFFVSPLLAQGRFPLDLEYTAAVERVSRSFVSIYVLPEGQKSLILDRNTIYGAGVIIDRNGLILTCSRLVEKSRHTIYVFPTTGERFQAKILGINRQYGVALLKVAASNLTPISFADSRKVLAGKLSLKFGNAFQTSKDFTPSVSVGTVSGVVRFPSLGPLLRTDAAVNQGDFGGPLTDSKGRLLGILLPIWVSSRTNTYVSYAVPSHTLQKLLVDLKSGYLGILMTVEETKRGGALIEEVDPAGPAAKAGILRGDIIVEFGGVSIESTAELVRALRKYMAGDRVQILLRRRGELFRTYVILSRRK